MFRHKYINPLQVIGTTTYPDLVKATKKVSKKPTGSKEK